MLPPPGGLASFPDGWRSREGAGGLRPPHASKVPPALRSSMGSGPLCSAWLLARRPASGLPRPCGKGRFLTRELEPPQDTCPLLQAGAAEGAVVAVAGLLGTHVPVAGASRSPERPGSGTDCGVVRQAGGGGQTALGATAVTAQQVLRTARPGQKLVVLPFHRVATVAHGQRSSRGRDSGPRPCQGRPSHTPGPGSRLRGGRVHEREHKRCPAVPGGSGAGSPPHLTAR